MSQGRFSADWLMLRESADRAARNAHLMRRFASVLPPRPRIIDLGAGTGAMARTLAPLIGREQHWLLVDSDPAALAEQANAMRAFVSRGGRAAEAWHFTPCACDVADALHALDAERADGVAASAFFDLAGAAWIARFARWLAARRLPLLATMTVDGRRNYFPADEEDAAVAAAFRRHQGRDKGLGPALGPDAHAALAHALGAHGYEVMEAPSDWRLGPDDCDLMRCLVAGEAAAAGAAADGWERRRLAASAGSALAAVIGHRDLLALPPEICQNNR